jgi:hypothetical protein
MNKPFTMATAGLLFAAMAAHLYRLFEGMPIMFGTHAVPMWASMVGALATGLLSVMICVEAKK